MNAPRTDLAVEALKQIAALHTTRGRPASTIGHRDPRVALYFKAIKLAERALESVEQEIAPAAQQRPGAGPQARDSRVAADQHKQRVYVLETGVYSDRLIQGVYATPEAAMAAWPHGSWRKVEREYQGTTYIHWANDLDWDGAGDVWEYEVQTDPD